MNITIEQAQKVIKLLKEEEKLKAFTSHKFIGTFIKLYESNYIEMLVEYKNKQTPKIFKEIHRQIACFLRDNQKALGINQNGKVKDMNIHHLETECKNWEFIQSE